MLYSKKASREAPREKSKRPQLSCNSCRARKVRCDRLQPCSACSMHQSSDQCHYELSPDERKPIQQAEHIRYLTRRVAYLEAQVLGLGGTIDDEDQSEMRKKRKASSTLRSDESQLSSQYPSPQLRDLTCTPPQMDVGQLAAASPPLSRRARTGPKPIAIPSSESDGSIATSCSQSPQIWNSPDHATTEYPMGPKRTLSSPNFTSHTHASGETKDDQAKSASALTHGSTQSMHLSNSERQSLALAHPQKLWGPLCYSAAPESMSIPTTASYLPFPSTGLMHPLPSVSYTNSTPSYSQSLSTASSASYPPSSYAHSTSSSLHTPSPSHPVSPTLSQHQGCCNGQLQTQPPSPLWGFDSGVANATSSHPFVHGENPNTAALIAELAAAQDDKDGMSQWQWKLAWTG